MNRKARIIVVGNEKGGTGKSTVAMHLAVSLLQGGASVQTIDLDARQATLTRYLENRRRRADRGHALCMPEHAAVPPTDDPAADEKRFEEVLERARAEHDVVLPADLFERRRSEPSVQGLVGGFLGRVGHVGEPTGRVGQCPRGSRDPPRGARNQRGQRAATSPVVGATARLTAAHALAR